MKKRFANQQTIGDTNRLLVIEWRIQMILSCDQNRQCQKEMLVVLMLTIKPNYKLSSSSWTSWLLLHCSGTPEIKTMVIRFFVITIRFIFFGAVFYCWKNMRTELNKFNESQHEDRKKSTIDIRSNCNRTKLSSSLALKATLRQSMRAALVLLNTMKIHGCLFLF